MRSVAIWRGGCRALECVLAEQGDSNGMFAEYADKHRGCALVTGR